MISRRITCKPANDNYRRLANYIAGVGPHPDQDKVLFCWTEGCWAGDDYEWGIQEAMDTQDLNLRSKKEKSYHLIVSFRPEDDDKLTPEMFKEIEQSFAASLGFAEHQRHCGVHQNTGNIHLHIAYNMIHPEKLTRHEPFRDFHTRDRVCRELERRFDLAVDNGRGQSQTPEAERLGDKPATMEAHSGLESFESYAKSKREALLRAMQDATSWRDVHVTLAAHGLAIVLHGNGLAIMSRHGKQACKASAVDRNLSKSRLEARFGPYQPPGPEVAAIPSLEYYQPRPNVRHRDAGNGELFKAWQTAMDARKAELLSIRDQARTEVAAITTYWQKTRQEIEQMPASRRDRATLLHRARQNERQVKRTLYDRAIEQRDQFRREKHFLTWAAFRKIAQNQQQQQAREQSQGLER
ncbi:TraI/MobA(P) family conjugative relaxase [Megalodesulfovibrio gigas]|uniref:Putative Relaxase/mobilization nuclease family protein n=1 Tax=Megalodesulfovibrio gigas (strain ATCC 19364 / DSM 1382 / NCIMB 9332 / VKM B-1759) TaxID=1121448 RepID=T2G7W9_MEGG1|nr:TraI/MobA(P) family conjugative relaxase [Megalodesulfovibrio gigas]AGW12383.1 putative Relaxase/mobilization nuclease family protein [Megalodesulfovibrio gigas DSM 1382 = ATCC 19364]